MEVRLIDANALLQECEKAYNFEDRRGQLAHCISAIKAAQTIYAQPVKLGRWVEVRRHRDSDGCIVTDYKCSECGIMLRDTNSDDRDSEFYCYHCGARMEVEEDGDQV